MKISDNHIERIVKYNLDDEFNSDIREIRNSVHNAFNTTLKENSVYMDLKIKDDDYIDLMHIVHTGCRDKLKDLINTFMEEGGIPEDIYMMYPNFHQMLYKFSSVDIDRFCNEISCIIIDCIDQEIVYLNRDNIDQILLLFSAARDDLKMLHDSTYKLMESQLASKSIFGIRHRKEIINKCNLLIGQIDKSMDKLSRIHHMMKESTYMLYDLALSLSFNEELKEKEFSFIQK